MTYKEMKVKASKMNKDEVIQLFRSSIVVDESRTICGACGKECYEFVSCTGCGVTFTHGIARKKYHSLETTVSIATGHTSHLAFGGVGTASFGIYFGTTYRLMYAA